MSQNLRQIKLRIKSIENTQKITRAMEMVSAAKLNRVKTSLDGMRPYFTGLDLMLKDLLSCAGSLHHPFLEKREHARAVALCVISSDTGLCGTYNHNIIEHAEEFLLARRDQSVKLITVGREAFNHFRKHTIITHSYLGLYGRYSAKMADEIARDLMRMFSAGEADEIYIAHTQFDPSLLHRTALEKFLAMKHAGGTDRDFLFEPATQEILDCMLPAFLTAKMRFIMLSAFTAEHSARMFAMKTATDNADDLIDKLTLQMNKARQFAITKEVLEISAAAEALKG